MASERDVQDVIKTLIAEGAGEGQEGMRRIAETILNRAEQRGISPAEVVRQRAQYTGFSNPGPAAVRAQSDPRALSAAQAAWELAQGPDDPTGGANHYFNPALAQPSWARSMTPTGTYGGHEFFTDRAVAPRRTAPAIQQQTPLMAQSRAITSPTGGDTGLQSALNTYATRQANAVTPATRGPQFGPMGSPNVGSLYSGIYPQQSNLTQPGAVNATVNALQQDPALAAALAKSVAPKPRVTVSTPYTTPQRMVGQEPGLARSMPALAAAASSAVGGPPTTRAVQSVAITPRLTNTQNIGAQRSEQMATRQPAPASVNPILTDASTSNPLADQRSEQALMRAQAAIPMRLPASTGIDIAPVQTYQQPYVKPVMQSFEAPAPVQVPVQPLPQMPIPRPTRAPLMAASAQPLPAQLPIMRQSQMPQVQVFGPSLRQPAPTPMTKVQQLIQTGLSPAAAYNALNTRGSDDAASRVNGRGGLSSYGGTPGSIG